MFPVLFFIAILVNAPIFAAHPLFTGDAFTEGLDNHLLEINSELFSGIENTDRSVETEFAITIGAMQNFDLLISLPYSTMMHNTEEIDRGWKNTTKSGKWIVNTISALNIAFKPTLHLSQISGSGSLLDCFETYLITSYLREKSSWHLNLGHINEKNGLNGVTGTFHGSVAGEYSLTSAFSFVGNLDLEHQYSNNIMISDFSALIGSIYSLTDCFAIDLGIKYTAGIEESGISVLGGTAWSF